MNIGLHLETNYALASEISSNLTLYGGYTPKISLENITDTDISELDVIIFHPAYDNSQREWDKTLNLIDSNKNKHFYMLTINAGERERYFGQKENLFYTKNNDFFANPTEQIEKNWKEKK